MSFLNGEFLVLEPEFLIFECVGSVLSKNFTLCVTYCMLRRRTLSLLCVACSVSIESLQV